MGGISIRIDEEEDGEDASLRMAGLQKIGWTCTA
jgi:hypothetical protein